MVLIEGFIAGDNVRLMGTQIMLRPLIMSDESLYLEQFSLNVQSILRVASLEQEQIYFRERIAKQEQGLTYFFGILEKETNNLCGALEIRNPQEHRGQLYCWLNELYWGKGYLQEAIALASEYYFGKTKEKFITAFVDESNKRSYWALKKAGFADLSKIPGAHGMQYELVLRNKL